MKKISILAIAAVMSLGLASCSKEAAQPNDGGVAGKTADVTISLSQGKSRATNPAGAQDDEVVITSASVFIGDASSVTKYDFDATELAAEAKTIEDVTVGKSVFVVANATKADGSAITTFPTDNLANVKAFAYNISAMASKLHTAVALSGSAAGTVTEDAATPGVATPMDVDLTPVVARLALKEVKAVNPAGTPGNMTITSFTVKGVYLTGFYNKFKFDGTHGAATDLYDFVTEADGTILPAVSTAMSGYGAMDEGTWAHSSLAATPSAANSWAYNIAGGSLPKLVIAVTGVNFSTAPTSMNPITIGGEQVTAQPTGATFYLTVSNYTFPEDATMSNFEAGNIFKISSLEFTSEDLGISPSTASVDLTVNVDVVPWNEVEIGGEF